MQLVILMGMINGFERRRRARPQAELGGFDTQSLMGFPVVFSYFLARPFNNCKDYAEQTQENYIFLT